ncbi:MAG: hypothetical protein ACQEXB_10645 [Bacillota bacterium]
MTSSVGLKRLEGLGGGAGQAPRLTARAWSGNQHTILKQPMLKNEKL